MISVAILTYYYEKWYPSHHTQQFLIMTHHPDTCILGQHVSSHLTGRDLDKCHLLFIVDPIADEVILRQDLLRPRMVYRIVDQIQGRLAVQVDSNRGGDASRAIHLQLELAEETGLLPRHGQPHVFTFARAETGIPNQLALPADGPPSRQEHVTRPRAPGIGAG